MSRRVRGLAVWRPKTHTLALIEQVKTVLAEYAAFLPLTLRQVFYRLVGAYEYEKTEQAYSRLGEALNRARRAGVIAWDTLRDDGWQLHTPWSWSSPEAVAVQFLHDLETFRLDRQQGQPVRLLIAVEAAGMLPQVQRVADDYGVPCYAAGGFDSSTGKYQLAAWFGQFSATELLHIGDHDPSGVHLFRNLAEDVKALAEDIGGRDLDIRFSRLAVTPEQIVQFGLPTVPPKATDRRSFEGETVQAEALPPDVMADIIREGILSRIDPAVLTAAIERERAIQTMSRAEAAQLIRQLP